ncbi:MAG: hypothetical protein ABFD18_06270 [Syntrophomonas sp.]
MKVITKCPARLKGKELSEQSEVDVPDMIARIWIDKGIAVPYQTPGIDTAKTDNQTEKEQPLEGQLNKTGHENARTDTAKTDNQTEKEQPLEGQLNKTGQEQTSGDNSDNPKNGGTANKSEGNKTANKNNSSATAVTKASQKTKNKSKK